MLKKLIFYNFFILSLTIYLYADTPITQCFEATISGNNNSKQTIYFCFTDYDLYEFVINKQNLSIIKNINVDELWNDLVKNQIITDKGIIFDKYYGEYADSELNFSNITLSEKFQNIKPQIQNILKQSNCNYFNLYSKFNKISKTDFDGLGLDINIIWNKLIEAGYIDKNGLILSELNDQPDKLKLIFQDTANLIWIAFRKAQAKSYTIPFKNYFKTHTSYTIKAYLKPPVNTLFGKIFLEDNPSFCVDKQQRDSIEIKDIVCDWAYYEPMFKNCKKILEKYPDFFLLKKNPYAILSIVISENRYEIFNFYSLDNNLTSENTLLLKIESILSAENKLMSINNKNNLTSLDKIKIYIKNLNLDVLSDTLLDNKILMDYIAIDEF